MSAPSLPASTGAPPFLTLDRVSGALRVHGPWLLVVVAALTTRLRFGFLGFHETFGSGDAHLILAKAMFISRGEFAPSGSLGPASEVFVDPPFIALFFAGLTRIGLPLDVLPLVVTPALTIAGLLALYAVARRAFDTQIALAGAVLAALLPRFALDSTEPDKVAYVLSFFLVAVWLASVGHESTGRTRILALVGSGVCMGLSLFSHNTALLFVPAFVIAHAAYARFQWRRIVDRYVVASLLLPLVFVGAFVLIQSRYDSDRFVPVAPTLPTTEAPAAEGPPVVFTPPNDDNQLLPAQFEHYWNTLNGLRRNGFQDSAWNLYFDAVREQVSSPVYVLAIIGFAIAAVIAVRQRRFELLPLMAWIAIVTLGFGIQYPARSHSTRYPSYVTPAFALFATAAIFYFARAVVAKFDEDNRATWAALVALPFVVFIAASYLMHEDPGTRRLYAPHRETAEYLTDNDLLSSDAQLLYIGWPSMTYYLLDDDPQVEPWLHAFGWGRVNINLLTPAYLEANNIRYYAHDPSGGDYFNSSETMLRRLQLNYDLRQRARLCGKDGQATCGTVYMTLYELTPKAAAAQ